MNTTLDVECPCCGIKTSLEVPEEVGEEALLFLCVSCEVSLLFMGGETFEVSGDDLRDLKDAEKGAVLGSAEVRDGGCLGIPDSEGSVSGEPEHGGRPISSMDIRYLRLMLDSTDDVSDFLEKM